MRTGDLREMREIRLRQDGEVLELLLKLGERSGAPSGNNTFYANEHRVHYYLAFVGKSSWFSGGLRLDLVGQHDRLRPVVSIEIR